MWSKQNEQKTLAKHVSCKCKCKFDGRKHNEKTCARKHVCEKDWLYLEF